MYENIDKMQYTPMMRQYLTIKEEYQDCFLFYRLGDFYELFFEDEVIEVQWSILETTSATKEIKDIMVSHVGRSTRNMTCEEYLVKWKG